MAGVWIVVVGLAVGALLSAGVLGAVGARVAKAGARGRLPAFVAIVVAAVLATGGSFALGGDIRVLPIAALLVLVAVAVHVVRAARRDGQALAAYAVVAGIGFAVAVAANYPSIDALFHPSHDEAPPEDEPWRAEETVRDEGEATDGE